MAYGIHTELELARTRGPRWLRDAVWDGLYHLRDDGCQGAPTDPIRDPTGEEHDPLWLDVGRWVEELKELHGLLGPEHEARFRQAFVRMRAARPGKWPVPGDLTRYLDAWREQRAPEAPPTPGRQRSLGPGLNRAAGLRILARGLGIEGEYLKRQAEREQAEALLPDAPAPAEAQPTEGNP